MLLAISNSLGSSHSDERTCIISLLEVPHYKEYYQQSITTSTLFNIQHTISTLHFDFEDKDGYTLLPEQAQLCLFKPTEMLWDGLCVERKCSAGPHRRSRLA